MKQEIDPKDTSRAYAFEMWMKAPMPLLIFLVEVIFLTLQVHSEEKRLEKDFGKDYLDYKKQVGRYFPLIICKNGSC